MRPLTGAAAAAHTRRVLIDEARVALAQRPRVRPAVVVALLERADAKSPHVGGVR